MRVNLGCGQAYMPGWVNVDASPDVKADIYLDAPEFVRQYGDQVEEVYMGHFLEHLLPGDALSLLTMLCERLGRGTTVSAVTPDIAAIWAAYQRGEVSNDQLNSSFIYSYVQPSHHVWCYDPPSLLELFRRAGFADPEPIDPLTWPPVFHKEGTESRWQCGVKATASGVRPADLGAPPEVVRLTWSEVFPQPAVDQAELPTTPLELAMYRVAQLRELLSAEIAVRADAEERVRQLERGTSPVPEPTGMLVTVWGSGYRFEPASGRATVHRVGRCRLEISTAWCGQGEAAAGLQGAPGRKGRTGHLPTGGPVHPRRARAVDHPRHHRTAQSGI